MTVCCQGPERKLTRCSVRAANTISMGQSAAGNETAGKNFSLWPEENLRSEHLKGGEVVVGGLRPLPGDSVSTLAPPCTASLQRARQRAAVMKQSETRKTHICPTLTPPSTPRAFSFHPVASVSLSFSIHHLPHSLPPSLPPSVLLSSPLPHFRARGCW